MNNASDMLAAAVVPTPVPAPPIVQKMTALQSNAGDKMQAVSATADAKRMNMGGLPDQSTFQTAAQIRHTGIGLEGNINPVIQDMATLPYNQIAQKYPGIGKEMVAKLLTAEQSQYAKTEGQRDLGQIVSDTALQAGRAAYGGLGGLAALGLGLGDRVLGTNAGVTVANHLKDADKAVEGYMSPTIQNQDEYDADKSSLQSQDNDAQYEKDKPNDGQLVAGLKYIGRGALDGASDALQDPQHIMSGLASAAGSVAVGGALSKGVGLAAKGLPLAMQAGMNGPWNTAGSRLAAAIGDQLPSQESVAIGSQFAGGSYADTAAKLSNTPGVSPEDANKGGLTAAAIAAPIGAIAGIAAKKMFDAPFATKDAAESGSNILASTAEQGLQGATQLGNNVGEQQYGDPNTSLLKGVGESIGSSAAGGLGLGVAMGAPSLAGHGAKAVGKAAIDGIAAKAAARNTANEKLSPVSDDKVAADGAAAQATMADPATHQTLAGAAEIAHNAGTTEDTPFEANAPGQSMVSIADKITHLGQFDPKEVEDSPLPDAVKEKLAGSTSRVDMMQRLGAVVNEHGLESEQGAPAAFELYHQMSKFMDLTNSDKAGVDALPKDHPAKAIVDQFESVAGSLAQSPTIGKALAKIHEITEEQAQKIVKPVTEENLNTKEGKQNIDNAATIAAIAPDKANLEVNQQILEHAKNGKVNLTQEQHQALMSSVAIMDAARKTADAQTVSGSKTRVNSVSDDIMSKDTAKEDKQRSATWYAKAIFQNMRAGNTDMARAHLSDLGDFAQHMSNKSDAVNQHYTQGGGDLVSFDARNPDSGEIYRGKPQGVTPKSPKSVDYAQTVNLEAKQVNNVYNGLSKAFPELKGGYREVSDLHPNLQGKPSEVSNLHRTGDRASPNSLIGSKDMATAAMDTKSEDTTKTAAKQLDNIEPKEQKTEATPGVNSEPQARDFDKGAEAKNDLEVEAVKPEATTDIAPGNVEGASEHTAPRTIQEAYPNLIGTNKEDTTTTNWFHEAFNVNEKVPSKLLGLEDPFKAVKEAVSSDAALRAFNGDDKRIAALPAGVSRAYQTYLNKLPQLRKTLEANLAKKLGDMNDPKSPGAKLEAGESNRWMATRVFNLLEKQPDGSFKYNRQLLDGAIMASLHWLLNTNQYRSEMDGDLVHALTGISLDRADQYVKTFGEGLSPVEAVRSLADHIQDFWGVKGKNDAGIGHTDGIPQSMAGELLRALRDTKFGDESLLNVQRFEVDDDTLRLMEDGEETQKRTAQRLVSNLDPEDKLFSAPSLLQQAALKGKTDPNGTHYGDEKLPVAPNQMRNPLVKNTAGQKSMLSKAQDVAYAFNEKVFKLYEAIGDKGLLQLFGGGDIEGRILNEQHRASLEGKNTTVRAAWDALKQRVMEMKTLPEGLDTVIKFAFNVSSVGRLQMLGAQNPQASKLMREAILPTWSTMDLSPGGNAEHTEFFQLALAQALGIKIHADAPDVILEKLHKAITDKFGGSIEMLQDHHAADGKELSPDFVRELKAEFAAAGEDLTPVALHALTEHARWLNSSEEEQAKFRTALYVEADGVTNGAANAIRMLTADHFSADQIENMAKTGQFFTDSKTMNDHRQRDSVDLYSKASSNLQSNLDALYRQHASDTNVATPLQIQMNHVQSLLLQLVPGIRFGDKGDLLTDRGVVKGPMTQMLYGAGAKSVAAGMVDQVTTAFYEHLSKTAQAIHDDPSLTLGQAMFGGDAKNANAQMKHFEDTLNGLLTSAPERTRDGLRLNPDLGARPISFMKMDPEKFEFKKAQLAALQENLHHLFVNPMRTGIQDTMGASLTESSKLLQSSTRVQSIVLEHLFQKRVEQLQAEKAKDPTWNKNDGLSQNELTGIVKDLIKTHPLVSTGDQTFFPVKQDQSDLKNVYSSALNDQFKTEPQIYAPADSGVKGLPMLNIGMGDGMMIQHLLSALHVTGLPVFDGFNFGLDKVAEGSRKANEAASEAWQGNPMRAVLEAFTHFNENLDPDLLKDPKLRSALAEALLPKWQRDKATASTLKVLIDEMQGKLTDGANMVDARHQVINEHQNYVDQMAGAQSPHLNEGKVLTGSSQDVADALNARLNEILNKGTAKAEPVKETVPVEPKPAGLAGLGQKLKTGSGIEKFSPTSLKNVLSQITFTPEQREVFTHILNVGGLKDYRVMLGDPESLSIYRKEKSLPTNGIGSATRGFIDPVNKMIYLHTTEPETLVHEAIHAATFNAVLTHYLGGDLGPNAKLVETSIGHLEKLMDQFRKLDINETLKTAPDFIDALRAVNDHLNKGTDIGKASALNEFMAWSLSNKGLVDTLKSNPSLIQMAKNVWQQIKSIVFGVKNTTSQPPRGMLTNIWANTAMIMHEQPKIADLNREVSLFQNKSYGTEDRLSKINTMFDQMFSNHFKPGDPVHKAGEYKDMQNANDLANIAIAQGNGFSMTEQAHNTFTNVVTALSSSMKLDGNTLLQMDQLYGHAMKKLTPDMLIDKSDPDAQRAQSIAQNKFDVLIGHAGTRMDAEKRSSLLAVFTGLALVDEGLRDALSKMDTPKAGRNEAGTLDAGIENLANKGMQWLSEKMGGQGDAKNVQTAIDTLTERLGSSALDAKSTMDEAMLAPNTLISRGNDALVGWIARGSDKVIAGAKDIQANSNNKAVKEAAKVAQFVASIVTEKNGKLVAEGVLSTLNRMENKRAITWRELASDVAGRTEASGGVFDMIKKVKSDVQQIRQAFRERVPTLIADRFDRTLTKAEWSAQHMGMGKSDLAAWTHSHSNEDILKMLADPKARASEKTHLETQLKQADPQHWAKVQEKAQQLARYMMTGEHGSNSLRNANAVADLLGERANPKRKVPDDNYRKMVDELVTHYALDKLSPDTQKSLTSLVQEQPKGMDFVLSYLTGQRKDEVSKATGMGKYNSEKGYVPALQQAGVHLQVCSDADAAKLLGQGYTRIGDYKGSKAEGSFDSRGYYYAPVSGRAAFSQGIAQNATHTSGGVEVCSGRSEGLTAGRITNRAEVDRITKNLAREGNQTTENLRAIYNELGRPVAYERTLDPVKLAVLNHDTNLARMIGVWRGRQAEEALASKVNFQLVDRLKEMHKQAVEDGKEGEYVNLNDPKSYGDDKITKDAYALVTPETKDYIKSRFGDEFMVRRDMLNDAFGYRKATIGDAWTGNTRWSPEIQKSMKDLTTAVFGNQAYRYLTTAEKYLQGAVSEAKTTIVVKSVVVPLSIFGSNMYQLLSRGVPIQDIVKALPRKIAEVENYSKGCIRIIDAESELRAAEGAKDFNTQHKLTAEIQRIRDGFKRLSIWPLLEAGEMSHISNSSLTRADLHLHQGKAAEYVHSLVDQLPLAVQKAGRYAIVGKDTALFAGMTKMLEYADFLGKALNYDHLTKRRGMDQKAALARSIEEFTNFDRLSGRSRSYMENMGMLWFMHFKLRSAKVAVSMLRNNPLQSLLSANLPRPHWAGHLGTPISDNGFSKAFEGAFHYSMGPGMMFHAPMMHPVGELMGHL